VTKKGGTNEHSFEHAAARDLPRLRRHRRTRRHRHVPLPFFTAYGLGLLLIAYLVLLAGVLMDNF
jgi:hypothetical protein